LGADLSIFRGKNSLQGVLYPLKKWEGGQAENHVIERPGLPDRLDFLFNFSYKSSRDPNNM
jgi:hypothetical protein